MEMITINVQMKVPVQRDSAGRRKDIFSLIYPILSQFDLCDGDVPELPAYDGQADYDVFESISSEETGERIRASEKRSRDDWERVEKEYMDKYGCTFSEFCKNPKLFETQVKN